MKVVLSIAVVALATVVLAVPLSVRRASRQDNTVTLANNSTPSIISPNVPELVPAIIDPNPTSPAPLPTLPPVVNVNASSTTVAPSTTPADEDDSSEEEEGDEEEDQDDQDQEDNNNEEQESDEQENDEEAKKRGIIYDIPGYLDANNGQLYVPIDVVANVGEGSGSVSQQDNQGGVNEVIEDMIVTVPLEDDTVPNDENAILVEPVTLGDDNIDNKDKQSSEEEENLSLPSSSSE